MSLTDVRQMLEQVHYRELGAMAAYANNDEEKAITELAALRDVLDDCLDRKTEESPEQQEDDDEKKESKEEKGCVVDEPHAAHNVHS